jgi:drug/metabolite transporter (DMT)-like permease
MNATTTDRSDYRRGLAMSALGMLVISPDALLLRLIEGASTWDVVFWRMLFQSASLFAWMLLSGGTGALARLRGIGRLGLASTAVLAVAQIGFVLAISNTSAANTLVLLATMPLFGALLGWFLLRERVAARTAAAIAVAFAGVAVIFADALGQGRWLGDVLALGTALLYAGNLVILRRAGPAVMVPSLCLSGLAAAAVALPLADPLAVGAPDLSILAWLGLVQLPVALILFFGGTRFVPAAEVALMSLIETALGPLLAWAGAGEAIRGSALAGGALVMLAIGGNSLLALRRGRG